MNRFWRRLSPQHFFFPLMLLTLITIGREAIAAQFTISWQDASSNEDGFKLERKTGATGTFAQIGLTPANTTTYLDPNLPNGTTYCYRVRAYNTAGNSAYSNEACATTSTAAFTLTVTKSGNGTVNGMGINCGTDCTQTYTSATSVSLSATPASGSTFSGWSGGGCSGTGMCTLLMNTNTTVTATFTAQTTTQKYALTVTKSGRGRGTVTSTSVMPAGQSAINCGTICSGSYTNGTIVSLTATLASGSTFSGWSGSCTGTGTCSVTMSATKSVTATFKRSRR